MPWRQVCLAARLALAFVAWTCRSVARVNRFHQAQHHTYSCWPRAFVQRCTASLHRDTWDQVGLRLHLMILFVGRAFISPVDCAAHLAHETARKAAVSVSCGSAAVELQPGERIVSAYMHIWAKGLTSFQISPGASASGRASTSPPSMFPSSSGNSLPGLGGSAGAWARQLRVDTACCDMYKWGWMFGLAHKRMSGDDLAVFISLSMPNRLHLCQNSKGCTTPGYWSGSSVLWFVIPPLLVRVLQWSAGFNILTEILLFQTLTFCLSGPSRMIYPVHEVCDELADSCT